MDRIRFLVYVVKGLRYRHSREWSRWWLAPIGAVLPKSAPPWMFRVFRYQVASWAAEDAGYWKVNDASI